MHSKIVVDYMIKSSTLLFCSRNKQLTLLTATLGSFPTLLTIVFADILSNLLIGIVPSHIVLAGSMVALLGVSTFSIYFITKILRAFSQFNIAS